MSTSAANGRATAKEEKLFQKRRLAPRLEGFFVVLAVLGGVLVLTGAIWGMDQYDHYTSSTGAQISALTGVGLFVFGVLAAFVTSLVNYERLRKLAVQQCLAVANKLDLGLATWQKKELGHRGSSEEVFKAFVAQLRKKKKPDGFDLKEFFEFAGGENGKTCGRLVEYLWRSELPPAAAS